MMNAATEAKGAEMSTTTNPFEARARARKVENLLAALERHLPDATTTDLLALVKLANAEGGSLLRDLASVEDVNTPSATTLASLEGRLEARLTREADNTDPFAGLA
jgi:hypothetical protein